jgi:hypothetical protein
MAGPAITLTSLDDRALRRLLDSLTADELKMLEEDNILDHKVCLKVARWLVIRCSVLAPQERYEMVQRYLDGARVIKRLDDACKAIGVTLEALEDPNMHILAAHVIELAFEGVEAAET